MKKKLLILGGIVLAALVAINVGWFAWRSMKYFPYTVGMEYNGLSLLVPRYVFTDADGYDYAVKYPDYPSFTGNMSIGMPASDENMFTDAIIIWPLTTGGYEYGALIHDEDIAYQIYIDENGNALDDADRMVIEQHRENIKALLDKANEQWILE